MSIEYDNYLKQHRGNVVKGYEWFCENLPDIVEESDAGWNIEFNHDNSKDEKEEYAAYDAYFYGGNKSYQVVQDFRKAWLHHIHNNPHHWQYWILHNDEPNEGVIVLDMPNNYILEMICDWWAFSWQKGNLNEIFKWYDGHKDYMMLGETTRSRVEDILKLMEEKIERG